MTAESRDFGRWHPDRWAFLTSTVWLSFVLAISFMEAPLKFLAPTITREVALEVGHIVFHALNRVELLLAALTLLSVTVGGSRRSKGTAGLLLVLFAVQCVLLFGVLDARTEAAIRGEQLPEAPWHWVYIGLEVVKVVLLVVLIREQVGVYRDRIHQDWKPASSR